MYHINRDNMKTEAGALQELSAFLDSVDERELAEAIVENRETVAILGAFMTTGLMTGDLSTPSNISMMIGLSFYLGMQAEKERASTENLLKDIDVK